MTRSLALLAMIVPLRAGPAVAQADSAAAGRSAKDGAYAAAQATRGEAEFQRTCAGCHVAGQFSGATFLKSWSGRSAYDLFSLIRTTMPFDNPGHLSREAYADVVAYLLRLNGYPPGERDLPTDDPSLRRITLESPSED